jgi:DNA-binding NarL/FixJ family response regulator
VAEIRILIAEDEPLAQSLLESVLEREPGMVVVGVVGDGVEAVAKTLALRPDILLLDLYMPGIHGLEVARQLAPGDVETRILALTVDASEETIVHAFRAGVRGFLLKTAANQYLTRAIRAVAEGETWIDRRTTSRLVDELAFLSRKLEAAERPDAALSDREREVLVCLGRGFTNKQIADELYLSLGTVKAHVSHILEKLGLSNRTGAALFARRIGLVEEDGLTANKRMPSPPPVRLRSELRSVDGSRAGKGH